VPKYTALLTIFTLLIEVNASDNFNAKASELDTMSRVI
jgi:hypothetical protein